MAWSEEITEGVAEGTELQREIGYGVVEEESEEDSWEMQK